ncbi:hypothetical protein Tco_1281467, partial [Tanacetum coccineum]
RLRNAAWFKEKAMLAEAHEFGQILDEEQLAFLADPCILDGQTAQTTIPNNAAFHTEDLDTYDSDLQGFEQTLVVDFTDNEITSDSNIIPYSQYLQETLHVAVLDTNLTREKIIDSQMDDMIKEKLALKQQIDSLEQNLSNKIKEKESLLQTFIVFKNESKEKESKYMDKETDLEKKIKELDNIVYKKAQRIKTTLYDGSVISSQHVACPVIDDEDTLILEENCLMNKLSWLQISHPNTDQSASSPVKIEAPKELPKYLDLDAELLNKQNVYNDLSKSYSQLEKHCISLELTMQLNQENFQKDSLSNNQNAFEILEYFRNNDLKAQLQAKDTTICKLKEHISMRETDKEEKVKHEMDEIETINIELEHSVAKLLSENERLHKEIEHLKKIYKDQFDSIEKTHALFKQNGKDTIENATQIPIATTIAPGMFKIDLEPLAPSEKLIATTPMNKVKKVRFSEPLTSSSNIQQVVQIVLWYLDSGCSKYMTGNRSQLMNFVSKFLGTVRFGNDQAAKIMGYGDYELGNVIITRVYYVEGLGHNLFSVE